MALEEGKALPPDLSRAQALFDRSCNLGWKLACNQKAGAPKEAPVPATPTAQPHQQRMTQRPTDRAPLEESCQEGDTDACLGLASMLLDGVGGPRDAKRALGIYKTACDQQDQRGCSSLGLAYLEGRGTKKDPAKAEKYLVESCNSNSAYACGALGEIYAARKSDADQSKARAAFDRACHKGDSRSCARFDELILKQR
jgi:TPR repeat protein